jgi:malectin (di-glucose binding ER protein)
VTNGAYRVNLLFSENYTGLQSVGARVFNVKLNGLLVLQNFDSFNTNVTNGQLAIEFGMLVQNPKTTPSKFFRWPIHPMMTLKFTYADGTPVIGNLNYAMSTSLLTIGGQLPLVNDQATCVLVSSPAVLGLMGQT